MKIIPTLALIVVGALSSTSTPRGAPEIDAKVDEAVGLTVDDPSITAQVKVALLLHRSTSSVNTKVGTTNGVVTVSGLAKNAAEKTLVTKLATDVSGVNSVFNNMTVAPAVPGTGVKPAKPGNLRVVSTRN